MSAEAHTPMTTMIPGAYERNTLTRRQPGSMGGGAFGSGSVPNSNSTLAAATILERQKEGGGGASQRPAPGLDPVAGDASGRR